MAGSEWYWAEDGVNKKTTTEFLAAGFVKFNKGKKKQGRWKLDENGTILHVNLYDGRNYTLQYMTSEGKAINSETCFPTAMWIKGIAV